MLPRRGHTAAVAIVLLRLPVRLFEAATEQWADMLREYALLSVSGSPQPYTLDEVAAAGNALACVTEALRLAASPDAQHVDLTLARARPEEFGLLQGVLDAVRHLIALGDLLVFPSLPEVLGLRGWICDEAAAQSAGARPTPWQLTSTSDDAADTEPAEWDASLVPPPEAPWLVADDRNRIVAASPAALALLGWQEEELVGQRLLVVIPRRLRERHLAGYTLSAVTGEGALLGQPLALPALARDGTEIPVTLTLTRHAARGGRHVYLGQLDQPG